MRFYQNNSIKRLFILTLSVSITACQSGTNNSTSSIATNPSNNKTIFLSSAVDGNFLQGKGSNDFCAQDINNPQPNKKWGVAVAPYDKIFIANDTYDIYMNKVQVGTWIASGSSFIDAERPQFLNYFINTPTEGSTMSIWFGTLSGLRTCYAWRSNDNSDSASVAAYNYATQSWGLGKSLNCDNLAHVLCVEQQ